jgi:GDP-L-fucose synthase
MKKILITGCSGLVGIHLVKETIMRNHLVIGVDIRKSDELPESDRFKFYELDLTKEENVRKLFEEEKPDAVFNCFGVKGSPLKAKTQPVDFLYPSMKINTEIIHQCAKNNVWLVFVSSVGVYAPAEKFLETDVWKTLPSENDWFPAWSKRIGELLIGSYRKQYGYKKWTIVRPANIFGEYDDFSGNGTVISSTIKKVYEAEEGSEIEAWGDGTPVRDFIYANDVAVAILNCYKYKINDIVNLGSGETITIKSMIEEVIKISGKKLTIKWDTTKPNGDMRRQMDTSLQNGHRLLPFIGFKEALKKTYDYYEKHYGKLDLNLDIEEFLEKGFYSGKVSEFIKEHEYEDYKKRLKNIIKKSKDKEAYGYRFEFRVPTEMSEEGFDYSRTIPAEEIPARWEFQKEKGWDVVQTWWELRDTKNIFNDDLFYFRDKVCRFLHKLYPGLKEWNIGHNDGLTIYENGDFIEPHIDGQNPNRFCVVLIYLSPEKEYIDGGGKLILQDKGYYDEVIPVDVNFAILDFSKNNPNHAVEAVKNDFVRYTYINFIERREFGPPKRYIGDEEVVEKWEPDTDVTYSSPFQIINETEEKVKKLI